MLLPFLEVLRQVGTPLDRPLAQDDLHLIYLGEGADPEAVLPLYPAIHLVERLAKQEGLPILGILAAQQVPIQQVGTIGHILSQSLTLLDLIVTVGPLVRLVNSGQDIRLRWESDAVWLEHDCADPEPNQHQQSRYNTIAHLLSMVRLALGPSWTFPVIHLSGLPCRELTELPDYANSELHFRQNRNALKIPRALLSQPVHRAISPPASTVDYAMWARSAPAPDFPASVRQVISALLPWGYPDINLLAAAAGLSVRSFQRQLSQANLSYAKLVEQVRFEQAVRWLQDPTVKLTDIAMELGYAEPANFSRAFKRWTGISPREFRIVHSEGQFYLRADEAGAQRGNDRDIIKRGAGLLDQ